MVCRLLSWNVDQGARSPAEAKQDDCRTCVRGARRRLRGAIIPKVGHGIGERSRRRYRPPVQFILVRCGGNRPNAAANRAGRGRSCRTQKEPAQALVMFGVGACQHADEGRATGVVHMDCSGPGARPARLQACVPASRRRRRARRGVAVEFVQTAPEHFLDQAFLRAEVIVDSGGFTFATRR